MQNLMCQIEVAKDIAQVERLLECESVEKKIREAFELGQTIFYACFDEVPIGLAWVSFNNFHPYWARPFVYVADAQRRKGIGSMLYRRLLVEPLPNNVLGFQFGADVQNTGLRAFIESVGFKRRLDCYSMVFDCDQMQQPDYSVLEENGFYLCDFEKALELSLDINAFLINAYTRDHYWSTPVSNDSVLWVQQLSKFDPNFSFVIHNGKAIKACITSRITSSILNIWWLYSDDKVNDYLQTILLSHLAKFALLKKITLADIEIDSTKTNFDQLYQSIPTKKIDIWQVYQHAFI
ncbi:Acetyltransferase (GNAT) family protein [Marinomonas spartinae]|uniref:Acetyltransferase (GNAT) family protein n=1 Tax=Marinomonas spartinae TaxID=1792290 RepID=A0A1A8TJT3_9GAMM|nr:GNAT family N-acetyltransferase [Marinomonas spartinae]SBS32537.1 Acetyltransferase (GNAT) family protein [Marinomonas spartinae]